MDTPKEKLAQWFDRQLPRALVLALAMLAADLGTTYAGFSISPYAHEVNPIYNALVPFLGPLGAWVPTIAQAVAAIVFPFWAGMVAKNWYLRTPLLAWLWTAAVAHAYAAFVFNLGSILAYLAWVGSHAH